jgi:tetratricopeptide (TPR) repeat protein
MAEKSNSSVRRLRRRVERALADGERGDGVVRDLESIVRQSEDSDRDALFAHRQLAELRLEESPWRAALHLRKLILAEAADDGVFALMGLCQAMLGNFRSAIAAYHRAIEQAPRNPWYHHNLGHLLDVGLGNSAAALRHLRLAHELESREDEITASLAHCLARLGQLAEARTLAAEAVRAAPGNRDHRALLEWVERGAPGVRANRKAGTPSKARVQVPVRAERSAERDAAKAADRAAERAAERTAERGDGRDPVARLLAVCMPDAGFSPAHVHRAQALWADFCRRRMLRVAKPAVYAAAIEYAIAMVHEVRGVTQAALGRRYRVAPASISSRYAEIRSTLALVPGDPRYSAAR